MGAGLQGFDFSYEGVKRVVGLFTGFVSVIASALHCFLYLNQRIHDDKRKRKKATYFLHAPRPLHLHSLKLQHHVVQCTIPLSPLSLPPFQASRP